MSNQIPTVKIADPRKPGDYAIINESDFDPAVHKRWGEAKAEASTAEIPADWQEMKWFALRSLAANFSNKPPANKAEAEAIIKAELARR
ncbi:hypothetical protein SJ05684_c10630 [Sinorhizobium sojae CCBAU 05684]|uniref:Uncharacterized protein n=1 Tax=Sinorhizobium sojae CCBAU 05684 TaxID=716928 RepID=A0A249P9B4_9HYPH|nr:hypothetical protein [Sinorhizobium sojae]ASY62520.1 hypothetical protein SJ05684_c10630 [Sinorhizobium sojae CCBAU 05684]